MGIYVTHQDMVNAFGKHEIDMLADRNLDGEYEPAVVDSHIDQAEQQINFAIAQRCALPLTAPTPEILGKIRQWALDITRYRLTGSSGVTVTTDVDMRYKEAREDLDKVTAGKIMLCVVSSNGGAGGGANGLNPTPLSAGMAEVVETDAGCCQQFSMGSLRDYTNFGRGFGGLNSQ